VKQLQALSLSQANPGKPLKPPSQPASSEDKENADILPPPPAGPVYQDGALISAGIAVSFYEIYNEQVRDLFSATPSSNKPPQHNLRVREDPKTGVFVENLTSHPVKNYRQVMSLLEIGSDARTTASTNMNATSSRSHAVFTLTLRSEIEDTATPGQTHERTSKISLVDLAGSERANSTGATHDRLREA
jgi:kinesin family protein 1